jgi:hypothetical protein
MKNGKSFSVLQFFMFKADDYLIDCHFGHHLSNHQSVSYLIHSMNSLLALSNIIKERLSRSA